MAAELVPTVITSVATGTKMIVETTSLLLDKRKRNQIITKGEIHYLGMVIERTIERDRMSARHELSMTAQDNLWESYLRFASRDPNSLYGEIALKMINQEAESYIKYCDDFDRLTTRGFFK